MSQDEEKSDRYVVKEFHTFNEALTLTGFGKFHYFLLLTCGLCLMSVIVETLNIGFIIPLIDFECAFKLTFNEKGFLSAAAFAGVVSSSYFWGFFADVSGRHKVMIICSSTAYLFSFTSSFSNSIWMLIITRFLVGFFISGLAANTYAYLGEFHCDKNRSRQLNFCGVFMALALTFCPVVGWLIVKFRDENSSYLHVPFLNANFSFWRLFLLICSSLSLVISIFLCFLPESPKFLLVHKRHNEALKVLEKIYKSKNGKSHFYPVARIEVDEQLITSQGERKSFFVQLWKQTTPLFKAPYLTSTWKLSFTLFSLFAVSSGFYLWVPEILNQLFKYPNKTVCEVVDIVIKSKQNSTSSATCGSSDTINATIYEITFLMGLFFSIVYFCDGLIINIIGKKRLLIFWFMVCGLSGIFVPFTQNFYAILFLLLILLTCGVCGAIISACIVDIYETNIRAISLCIILIIGRIGAIVGSIFVSRMIGTYCTAMFESFAFVLILSAIVSYMLRD